MSNSIYALIGLSVGIALWVFGWWREKRAQLGVVPWLPPVYIQFTGLIIILVFAAELIAATTGVTWTSPFRR